ncbi:hypothetical protein A2U01_0053149, partial [Trifolium medium]|nr:hypothetical protein [Trifolium medium]
FWLLRCAQPVLRYVQCLCCVVGLVLLAVRRAGVTCAARSSVAVVPVFLLSVARRTGVAAPRAELG